MKIKTFLAVLSVVLLSVCKKEKPIEEENFPIAVNYFQTYNNPQFKLKDYPEIQGTYEIDGYVGIFQRLGINEAHVQHNSNHCTEFDPARNKLKIRVATEKRDVELDVINRIGDNLYLSKNHKVVRARLQFKDSGELKAFRVFELDNDERKQDALTGREEMDPQKRSAIGVAQGPKEGYKECIEFIEESIKIGEQEGKQDF